MEKYTTPLSISYPFGKTILNKGTKEEIVIESEEETKKQELIAYFDSCVDDDGICRPYLSI